MGKIKIPSDQSEEDMRRILESSDVKHQISELNIKDQQVICPFTRMCSNINSKIEKVKDVNGLVNYGLVLMIPLLAVSSWLGFPAEDLSACRSAFIEITSKNYKRTIIVNAKSEMPSNINGSHGGKHWSWWKKSALL
ncbi:hypothetical protein ACH5RR_006663 [Cinchona calisaya]|uniref:Uncharacterized protein n=1 Tax=Cinchona calisaya TaxID=153742 RepID=A0ABD3APY1_9GENT